MSVRLNIVKNGAYEYIRVFRSVRNAEGKPRSVCIKNFGQYKAGDPQSEALVQQAQAFVDEMNATEARSKAKLGQQQIQNLLQQARKNSASSASHLPTGLLNVGVIPLKVLWEELGMHDAFRYLGGKRNIEFDYGEEVFYQVASRLLNPCSKKASFEARHNYLYDFSGIHNLNGVYRSLDLLCEDKKSLVRSINRGVNKLINREITAAFYDVTTYAFESVDADSIRNFGMSKDGKPGEVQVVMGLLMDQYGIPIDYELFPGNTSEFSTMEPIIRAFIKSNNIKKIIVVADRGLNSGDNLKLLKDLECDFVIAQKISNCDEDVKTQVLDESNWESVVYDNDGVVTMKYKSLTVSKDIFETKIAKSGRAYKSKNVIDTLSVKWVVTHSSKRREKDDADLDRAIEKANKAIEQGYATAKGRGFKSLIEFEDKAKNPKLNLKLIEDKRKWAGYYAICTNLLNEDNANIAQIYSQLWRIENCFRVSKSMLKARPCYVWSEAHIRGHFAICFLSLVLEKLMEYQVLTSSQKDEVAPIPNITMINSLRAAAVTKITAGSETVYVKVSGNEEFDRILRMYGLEPMNTIEDAQSLRRKFKMRKIV